MSTITIPPRPRAVVEKSKPRLALAHARAFCRRHIGRTIVIVLVLGALYLAFWNDDDKRPHPRYECINSCSLTRGKDMDDWHACVDRCPQF